MLNCSTVCKLWCHFGSHLSCIPAEKLKNLKPNPGVLKEYRRREEEFFKRAKDVDQITALRDEQKAKYDGLQKQRLDEFMTGFNEVERDVSGSSWS